MSTTGDVLDWLVANGKVTREEIDAGAVHVCRTNEGTAVDDE